MTAGPQGHGATSFLKRLQLSLCFHCRLLGSSVEERKGLQPDLPPSEPADFALAHCHPLRRNPPSCLYGSSRLRAQPGPSRWRPGPWPWLLLPSWSPHPAVGLLNAQQPLSDPSSHQGSPPFTAWGVLPGSFASCHTEKGSVCVIPK